MEPVLQTSGRPRKPLLVYDGQCDFCRYWIVHWQWLTDGYVAYAPSQEVAKEFPDIPPEAFQESVRLIEPDGQVYAGAHAACRAMAKVPGCSWALWLYEHVPGARPLADGTYHYVARHRSRLMGVTRWLWGKDPNPPTYFLTRWLYLRLLAVIYFVVFLSMWRQVTGLIGQEGILPAREFLRAVSLQLGPERYWYFPTLAWVRADDQFLTALCALGALASLLLLFRVAPALMLLVAWLCYLSLTVVGQLFLNYQWDLLLLEAGFLAIFLAPWRLLPRLDHEPPPSHVVLFLHRILLFRLVLCSGLVKLRGGDGSWPSLTALEFHFETQPLPTWMGWAFHQMPHEIHHALAFLLLAIELVTPFMLFLPRRPRLWAFWLLVGVQGVIVLTGNFGFFGWLSIALCLLLLDDPMLRRIVPRRLRREAEINHAETPIPSLQRLAIGSAGAAVMLLSALHLAGFFAGYRNLPAPVQQAIVVAHPWRIVNPYGLFGWMTKTRPEIVIEGSNDDVTWQAYEFKWKPGDVQHRPGFASPYQPRLDWQMWFAALGSAEDDTWIIRFVTQLLKGSPEVTGLLAHNPFPDHPPKYIRALLYDYRFTCWGERKGCGAWWRRELIGLYLPAMTLAPKDPQMQVRLKGPVAPQFSAEPVRPLAVGRLLDFLPQTQLAEDQTRVI